MKNRLSYSQAVGRVEQIVETLESGQTDIDQLGVLLKEAKKLLAQCNAELGKVENDVQKILSD